jgi:hypothetical protein
MPSAWLPLVATVLFRCFASGKVDPTNIKHALWPTASPRPDKNGYASWYKSVNDSTNSLVWIGGDELPHVPADAKVDIFYLTKPIFTIIGRTTGIWHAGIGFRIQNGSSYMFEYTSLEFMAAVAYPDKGNATVGAPLHFPSAAIVDYHIDPSGKTFPVNGPAWKEEIAVGTTSGASMNAFAKWAFGFGVNHSRYLVWRLLQDGTEATILESHECFDFALQGLRYLRSLPSTSIVVSELPRTIVNVYASAIEDITYNATVSDFFSSKRRVLEEWVELTKELPYPFWKHSTEWYWPAWFSTTPYVGGSGLLVEDTDYPTKYHRYRLAWPKKFKSKTTTQGVQRLNVPLFDASSPPTFVQQFQV